MTSRRGHFKFKLPAAHFEIQIAMSNPCLLMTESATLQHQRDENFGMVTDRVRVMRRPEQQGNQNCPHGPELQNCVCVCVCVCVCARARARVCVCVIVRLCRPVKWDLDILALDI